jgi:hypothetical protein
MTKSAPLLLDFYTSLDKSSREVIQEAIQGIAPSTVPLTHVIDVQPKED